jgi:hypothetical protein
MVTMADTAPCTHRTHLWRRSAPTFSSLLRIIAVKPLNRAKPRFGLTTNGNGCAIFKTSAGIAKKA